MIFDREQLANAVQGITIRLVDLLPTFCKPFTQFEAYYVMLCNTSFVRHELTGLFFDKFRLVKFCTTQINKISLVFW